MDQHWTGGRSLHEGEGQDEARGETPWKTVKKGGPCGAVAFVDETSRTIRQYLTLSKFVKFYKIYD